MFSYIIALLAFIFFLANPLSQLFLSIGGRGGEGGGGGPPSPPQIRRTPRPPINLDLLALEETTTTNDNTTTPRQCTKDSYSVHVFSREPLVLYIENFLSFEEQRHLLDISAPLFAPSTITHNGGSSSQHNPTIRDSEVAVVPRTAAVRCVEDRARALQGWRDDVWIERLRTQRYRPGGHYAHHFDWSSSRGGWGRVSSFMAWVDASSGCSSGQEEKEGGDEERLEGGGTEFPLLARRGDQRWCAFVECDDSEEEGEEKGKTGVVFKPVAGNAVYWENFRADSTGRGYDETWHAGLPVVKGVKVGLNIWSWGRID
ncbi:hypothetical protein B0T17DRAFT_508600 [Bombardia bombarda]|uniref:Prolyl 4-hydroxylase alpha subunit domain-containing protein n=1 Tax=Bombardia bombarda TaxID=252184 RepID=A0AA40C177_9PEZI|nr:hypothetical protein B0T17DRAFT_508600 [Bombardia bombarda]